jgi:hypothetical protein
MAKAEIKSAIQTSGTITSPKETIAKGKVQARLTAVKWVGFCVAVLILGGLAFSFMFPTQSKDIWIVLVPLISSGLSALSFLGVGQRQQE